MKITLDYLKFSKKKHHYSLTVDGPDKKYKHVFTISSGDWGDANNGTDRLLDFIKEVIKQTNEVSIPLSNEDLQ